MLFSVITGRQRGSSQRQGREEGLYNLPKEQNTGSSSTRSSFSSKADSHLPVRPARPSQELRQEPASVEADDETTLSNDTKNNPPKAASYLSQTVNKSLLFHYYGEDLDMEAMMGMIDTATKPTAAENSRPSRASNRASAPPRPPSGAAALQRQGSTASNADSRPMGSNAEQVRKSLSQSLRGSMAMVDHTKMKSSNMGSGVSVVQANVPDPETAGAESNESQQSNEEEENKPKSLSQLMNRISKHNSQSLIAAQRDEDSDASKASGVVPLPQYVPTDRTGRSINRVSMSPSGTRRASQRTSDRTSARATVNTSSPPPPGGAAGGQQEQEKPRAPSTRPVQKSIVNMGTIPGYRASGLDRVTVNENVARQVTQPSVREPFKFGEQNIVVSSGLVGEMMKLPENRKITTPMADQQPSTNPNRGSSGASGAGRNTLSINKQNRLLMAHSTLSSEAAQKKAQYLSDQFEFKKPFLGAGRENRTDFFKTRADLYETGLQIVLDKKLFEPAISLRAEAQMDAVDSGMRAFKMLHDAYKIRAFAAWKDETFLRRLYYLRPLAMREENECRRSLLRLAFTAWLIMYDVMEKQERKEKKNYDDYRLSEKLAPADYIPSFEETEEMEFHEGNRIIRPQDDTGRLDVHRASQRSTTATRATAAMLDGAAGGPRVLQRADTDHHEFIAPYEQRAPSANLGRKSQMTGVEIDPDDPAVLGRKSGTQVDISPDAEPVLGRKSQRTMVDIVPEEKDPHLARKTKNTMVDIGPDAPDEKTLGRKSKRTMVDISPDGFLRMDGEKPRDSAKGATDKNLPAYLMKPKRNLDAGWMRKQGSHEEEGVFVSMPRGPGGPANNDPRFFMQQQKPTKIVTHRGVDVVADHDHIKPADTYVRRSVDHRPQAILNHMERSKRIYSGKGRIDVAHGQAGPDSRPESGMVDTRKQLDELGNMMADMALGGEGEETPKLTAGTDNLPSGGSTGAPMLSSFPPPGAAAEGAQIMTMAAPEGEAADEAMEMGDEEEEKQANIDTHVSSVRAMVKASFRRFTSSGRLAMRG
ncbi:unnamed protein product [Amoebophrya sp. A120]|nr:unnamed protein product [Amoebophrya sp. A120]|eukprot:GSA120T00005858001.1